MNYDMESTWNSAWVSITSVMMMMTEKIDPGDTYIITGSLFL